MTDEPTDPAFDELLAYLRRDRGFDFAGYKRGGLARRVRKRMADVGLDSFAEYADFLEVHPTEFPALFDAILINVTGFFRDPAVWDFLAAEVVPRLLADKPAGAPVRVWSAGCASGEEAYTLAMVLAEALGVESFRERVKIYGTDLDENALAAARQGVYAAAELAEVRPGWRDKYFEPGDERRVFRRDLRRNVIFGRHDLMQDAPIPRLDLLACRNCLMYFNAEAQARVLDRFHFAVNDGGYVLLGRAEMLLSHSHAFAAVDVKRRIFQKLPGAGRPARRAWTAAPPADEPANPLVNHVRVREAAFDSGPVAQLVVDPNGFLALANLNARVQFNLAVQDLGRPLADLHLPVRGPDLRDAVERAAADGRTVVLRDVEWAKPGTEAEFFDVQIVPMRDHAAAGLLGISVTFPAVTAARRLRDELRRTHVDLESAYEELQASNEELETTNEELEMTNEELQSTNEELETMNGELQAANEELQTMNADSRQRSDELNQVNAFLESILAGFRGGVVVVDRDLVVLVWNQRAEDLWGVRAGEARGRNFLNLDIGLPVAEVRPAVRACAAGEGGGELTLAAVNRRGKPFRCRVTCTPLFGSAQEARGAILLMEEVPSEKSS